MVLRSVDPLLDAEAVRVVKMLPKWQPGKQGGKPVNVWYSVPVTFSFSGPVSVFSQTSMPDFYRFINMNIVYPQEAKNASDTGSIFVVVKLTKGGIIKECKAFTEKKEIKVPVLQEVVIVGYKPTGEISEETKAKAGANDHTSLKNECLRIANLLSINEIPDWKDKDVEFALPFKFILR